MALASSSLPARDVSAAPIAQRTPSGLNWSLTARRCCQVSQSSPDRTFWLSPQSCVPRGTTTNQHGWPVTVRSAAVTGLPQPRPGAWALDCTSNVVVPEPDAPNPAQGTSSVVYLVKNSLVSRSALDTSCPSAIRSSTLPFTALNGIETCAGTANPSPARKKLLSWGDTYSGPA